MISIFDILRLSIRMSYTITHHCKYLGLHLDAMYQEYFWMALGLNNVLFGVKLKEGLGALGAGSFASDETFANGAGGLKF